MTYADDFTIGSQEEMIQLIDEMGFVPFFDNEIEGFSLEEHITPGCWYDDGDNGFWPAWEWKGPVIRESKCAYGKFLRGKAMYVSAKWFPDFANYRRDGYDFDARYDDGLAPRQDMDFYEVLDANAPILSKSLKQIGGYGRNGRKGFDTILARLQKQCYVVTADFRYSMDRFGEPYGWGVAVYTTPEKMFGRKFTDAVYKRTPEESYARILKHLRKILPEASQEEIEKILR